MKNILISGATGLIGSKLIPILKEKGYSVSILSRSAKHIQDITSYKWDITKGELPQEAIDKADVIIHLAGANVGSQRWTSKRKQEIIDSRVKSGELILDKINKSNKKPEAFITASAVGYYGLISSDKIFDESDPPANDFFGAVGEAWESVLAHTSQLEIRSVALRIGIVLAKDVGALQKMALPLKFGFGTPLGNGKQFIPWIHIDDIVSLFVKAMEDESMQGAYNAAAPEQISNYGFMKTLCTVRKRLFIPIGVPAFLLKLVLGEMAGIVLEGSLVSSKKVLESGFKFQHPNLEDALIDLKS